MADDAEDTQLTFGSDGELRAETEDDGEAGDGHGDGRTDFGEEPGEHETKGGYNRYDVSSLLQKAVRRSDEEVAAWAAWELVRSGYAWHFWDRVTLYCIEDLRAGSEVVLLVERYETLATERYEEESWEGRLCAVHAALAAARAPSTREATHADAYFGAVAEERAAARAEGREPAASFPADDLVPGGAFDVIFDKHTYEGKKRDRGTRHFRVHAGRVGPEGEPDLSRRWRRRHLELTDEDYDERELEHALAPVDPEDRWSEPDL